MLYHVTSGLSTWLLGGWVMKGGGELRQYIGCGVLCMRKWAGMKATLGNFARVAQWKSCDGFRMMSGVHA
jgi:hypothetical protein